MPSSQYMKPWKDPKKSIIIAVAVSVAAVAAIAAIVMLALFLGNKESDDEAPAASSAAVPPTDGQIYRANLAADEADLRAVFMAAGVAAIEKVPPSKPAADDILTQLIGGDVHSGMVVELWFDGPIAVTARMISGGRTEEMIQIGMEPNDALSSMTVTMP